MYKCVPQVVSQQQYAAHPSQNTALGAGKELRDFNDTVYSFFESDIYLIPRVCFCVLFSVVERFFASRDV